MTLAAQTCAELKKAGMLLAEARRRRGISVSKLAARMGVDRRTLAQLEAGNPAVSLGVFFQALSALDLLRGVEEVLRPENDIEAISAAVRRARGRLASRKAIGDEEVEF